jgi:hypothetical protein
VVATSSVHLAGRQRIITCRVQPPESDVSRLSAELGTLGGLRSDEDVAPALPPCHSWINKIPLEKWCANRLLNHQFAPDCRICE